MQDSDPSSSHSESDYSGITGGIITGGTGTVVTDSNGYPDLYGGGIFIDGGSLDMQGGTIYKCSTEGNDSRGGGGIYIKSGSVNMHGGTIYQCSSIQGGGVYVDVAVDATGNVSGVGSFSMSDSATIMDCSAEYGGGVFVSCGEESPAIFTMDGGTITGCKANVEGGGVESYGTFQMRGSSEISGCEASNGGGVSIGAEEADSTFDMSDNAVIRSCKATGANGEGGGAYVSASGIQGADESTTTFTMSGNASISDCTAANTNAGAILIHGENRTWPDGTTHNAFGIMKANGGTVDGTVCMDVAGDQNAAGITSAGETATIFNGDVVNDGGTISGGTFNGNVSNNTVSNASSGTGTGTISGGTFNGSVANNSGIINGGIFHSSVTNNNGTISGGSFHGSVTGTDVHAVTFESNGGSSVLTQWRTSNATATKPADPTKTGYTFEGWFTNSGLTAEYDFDTYVTADITLYAKWKPVIYTVKFDLNEGTGTAPADITAEYDAEVAMPDETGFSRQGYQFAGWKNQSTRLDYSAGANYRNLASEQGTVITLHAVWSQNTHRIRYQYTNTVNGAPALPPEADGAYNEKYDVEDAPTLDGYTFSGWSSDNVSLSNGVFTMPDHDVTFTGTWTRNTVPYTPSAPTIYSVSSPSSTEHGSITVSPRRASAGTTITITVKPDKGYTLETITVTVDWSGRKLDLVNKGNNQYTFRMPSGSVTVATTFMEDNSMLNFFVDVPADAYYYDAVLWAAENGITFGTSATTYSPEDPCTRGQMAAFLWRLNGSPDVSGEIPFDDVSDGAYYRDAVLWCYQQGITTGTSDTTFSPEDPCTRGQMAAFLYRMKKSPAVSGEMPFTDVEASAYYADAVIWAKQKGITLGTSDGENPTYSPEEACTRGQMAVFLYRVKDVEG